MASSTPSSRIDEFAAIIRTLPEKRLYEKQDLCTEQFKIYADSEIEVFYAPFDAVAESAKVAIVGITPGFQQMEIGFRFARSFLLEGHSGTEACVEAKRQASFAGQMRKNLVDMLDEIGLPGAHGLSSSGELFGSEANQLHTTSALRYPVFVQGENFYRSQTVTEQTSAFEAVRERNAWPGVGRGAKCADCSTRESRRRVPRYSCSLARSRPGAVRLWLSASLPG